MSNTVLVTGTSSGLGRATARFFQAKGWNVVATMRSPERESELGLLPNTLVTRLDVQDSASVAAAIDAGIAAFGRIDVLINNAGYGAFGPLEATPPGKMRRQFEVNVLGPLATIHAILPHFRAHGGGAIVNVSSIGGQMSFPLGALYHGSKFALEGLSESLWYELGAIGVRMKIVQPGGMKTDFGGRSLDFSNDPGIAAYQPLVKSVIDVLGPMMENGATPASVAAVVYAAAIDESDRLRHVAGDDAQRFLALRRGSGDDDFLGTMKAQFGLAT